MQQQKNVNLRDYVEKNAQLQIRRGIIYSNMSAKSDMLKVRILPDMVSYAEEDLPNYACYNPTMMIKGVAEKDTRDINIATQVWIICTSDFLVGWVLGEANQQYDVEESKVDDPWGFNVFKSHLLRTHLNTKSAEYSELKVLFSNARFVSTYTEAGIGEGSSPANAVGLDIVNVRTGERYMMLQSGTTFALTQDTLYLRVGSPKDASNNPSSYIRMTAGSIEMVADNISIHGRNATSLGKHGMKVAGMLGASTAVDGSVLVALQDITC